ncbi:MAG: nucleotidyltransferase family protein [Candidatus Sungbacteria bacterium]|nr:nucleotidyltransferase family protein [Candidatus Sungbacteria bacterium]
MKAIILAGGFGTRLAKITGERPKPLAEVGGVTILEHQVNLLQKHGIFDIRLSLYHKADQVIAFCEAKWPGKFEYVVEPRPLGTGGGIKFASRDLKEPFLVLNGDGLTDVDISAMMRSLPNTIMCVEVSDARDFGLLNIDNGKIKEFLEKPQEKITGYVNCGFYLLSPTVFENTPEEFMIEKEIFPRLAESGELNVFLHKGYWIDAGTEERYKKANEEVRKWKEI